MKSGSGSPQPWILCALLLLAPALALGQPLSPVPGTPYQGGSEAITYTPLSSPTVITTDDDDGNFTVQLPFPFRFFNDDYTEVLLTTNGVMAFPPHVGTTFLSLSNATPGQPSAPNNWIAPFWDDQRLYSSNAGWVGHRTEGTAPTRTWTLEWHNLSRFGAQSDRFSMRVRLHEGASGRFDVEYGSFSGTGFYTSTMGFEDRNGNAVQFRPCGISCSAADFQAFANRRLVYTQDPGIELVAIGVEAPEFAFLGAETTMVATTQSLHGNPIGPFDIAIEGDHDPAFSQPRVLGTARVATQPFQLLRSTVRVRARAEDGFQIGRPLFVRLNVDPGNEVREVNETNNVVAAPAPVRLLQGRPDLRLEDVRLDRYQVDSGASLQVTVRVSNAGGEPAGARDVGIYLSSNPVVTPRDRRLGATQVNLEAGQEATRTVMVTVPVETNSGSYYIGAFADPDNTLEELSESNNGLAAFRMLEVRGAQLGILTARLPSAVIGESYNALLRGAGGSGNYRWRVSSGQLPTGLGATDSSGEFFGRPRAVGCERFEIELTDTDVSQTARQMLELCVVELDTPLAVVNRSLPEAVAGRNYRFPLTAAGTEPGSEPTWSGTDLPDGLVLTSAGVLAGAPVRSGSFSFDVEVTDGMGTASRTLDLLVLEDGTLRINPAPLPAGQLGEPYQAQLESMGGEEPLNWVLLGSLGELGLNLSSSGLLSGVPRRAGRFQVRVEVQDAGSPPNQAAASANLVLDVSSDARLRIRTNSLPTAIEGRGYDQAIHAVGGVAPYTWSFEGRLPDGLATVETPSELRVVGTPTRVGASTLLVSVTDPEGRTAQRAFAIEVVEPPPIPVEEGSDCASAGPAPWAIAFALLAWRRRNPPPRPDLPATEL